jgi:D-alanyl-D-alanine carboxypeptidase
MVGVPTEEDRMSLRARIVAACAAAVLTAGVCGSALAADAAGTASYGDVRQILHRLTTVDGAPGALVEVRDARGRTVLASGTADLATGAPVAGGSRFRIGSMTKTYVATVVLQLAAEHRVALDAPIARYLPGVVESHGNDGRDITVRELLQHTSGLPDYLDHLSMRKVLNHPLARYSPRELLDIALDHRRLFAPGTDWYYSNTDYVVAGMLVEKVTGRPYGAEIERRIIRPLGLRGTSVPVDAPGIPGPHPQGYVDEGGSGPVDMTAFNPSVAYASGAMISSGADMDRFLAALLGGRLLPPAELRAMKTTRPTGDSAGDGYGLGLESTPLPCGGRYWGHDGGIVGFETVSGTAYGRQVTVMVNLGPSGTAGQEADMRAAITTALCEGR